LQAGATRIPSGTDAFVDSADEHLVLEGVQVDQRVLMAAMAQAEGQGNSIAAGIEVSRTGL
jgi:hypothetical protein